MDNVLFGPDPHLDAFSTTYSYDAAGNIRQLMRRGLIGTGSTLQSDTIDLLDYTYAGSDSLSSILVSVKDQASNPVAQPLGVAASLNGYGHDGNGNLTLAGPVLLAQYNIMNLPTSITTNAGKRHFAYVYGGGKYSARIETTPSPNPIEETRHYLGGIEFVEGEPESYNFGDGRIVYSDTVPPRPQFRLHDHLGNTVVFFEDKNLDGCIATEADTSGLAMEVLQRLWYYPFGMNMENLSTWETAPGQAYRYNGKERDTLSGWYEYGFRWYDAGIGRFTGVDPIADQFPWVSVFNYAENEPVAHIDLYGLQKIFSAGSEGVSGTYLGRLGTSNEERVLHNNYHVSRAKKLFSEGSAEQIEKFAPEFMKDNVSGKLLRSQDLDQVYYDFAKKYKDDPYNEHAIAIYEGNFTNEDGSSFKGYQVGKVVHGERREVFIGGSTIPGGDFFFWRVHSAIHNHPNGTTEFSGMGPNGGGPRSSYMDWNDLGWAVNYNAPLYLVTPANSIMSKFDPVLYKKYMEETGANPYKWYERDRQVRRAITTKSLIRQ